MRGSLLDGVTLGQSGPVSDLLESCSADPDRRLLMWPGGTWTVHDLASTARAFALELTNRGISAGDRVAIVSGNSPRRLAWQFAIWWIGAVEVSVNSELRGPLLAFVLADAELSFLVVEREFLELVSDQPVPVLIIDEHVAGFVTASQAADLDQVALSMNPSGLATILYTSGTTGPSKGVMLPRAYFSNLGAVWAGALHLSTDDIGYFVLPFFHVDCHIAICAVIQSRSTLAFDRRFSASRWWSQIAGWKCTWAMCIGALLSIVMATGDGRPPEPIALTRLLGGPIPRNAYTHFEDDLGIPILALYGQTEACGPSMDTFGRRRRSAIGTPCCGFDVEVHDPLGESVAVGQLGEIVYRPRAANLVALGYWHRDDATVQASRGLWFHSGDFGRFDEDGFLHFAGRMTDCLRRRGENVSTHELEAVLNQAPGVGESAAVGVVDEMGGEDEIKVFIVPASDSFNVEEFFAYCVDMLPAYAVPQFVELTEASQFVRSVGTGVVQKRLLSRDVTGPRVHRRAPRVDGSG